jgi:hypothetical protein
MFLVDQENGALEREVSRRVFAQTLRRTVASLRDLGKEVIVLGSIPPQGVNVPDCLARNLLPLSGFSSCSVPAARAGAYIEFADAEIQRLAAETPGLCTDRPSRILCAGTSCRVEQDGQILYANDDHVNMHGARYLARHWTLDRCLAAPGIASAMPSR